MPLTRRTALGMLALLAVGRPAAAQHAVPPFSGPHPTPRPGIDASRVTPAAALASEPEDVRATFAVARRIPAVLDGIRCHCGCAEQDDTYSLLSCYEGEGMARHCLLCQGHARLAGRLHDAGRPLDEIRAAIDARYA